MNHRTRTFVALTAMACASLFVLLQSRNGQPLPTLAPQADRIVICKAAHTMTLYHRQQVLAMYHVALGRGGIGAKVHAGDSRVPEGLYPVTGRNARSAFHLALRLGYPTPKQREEAARQGIDPGGDIMIHGIHNGFGWLGDLQHSLDWTRGCIAVTDTEMDQIWSAVPVGTPVQIQP